MKRKSILLLICLLLIACLTFAACNNNNNTDDDNNSGDTNTWPSISYITDAEKYTGAGDITHTTSFADGSSGVYINNATDASVAAYLTQMENAGWTLSVGPVDREDSTAWGYTKGESTCTIRIYDTAQTEERSGGNYSFNLYIGFENDGLEPNPGGGGEPNTSGISVSDFAYDLGNHYYISSRWDVTSYDLNDNEYIYQEYRRIALIGGVYFIETYDFNYERSNAQGNFAQAFYIPNGSDYQLYSRFDASEDFELASSSTTNNEFSNALSIALGETSLTKAKTRVTADTIQYVTAGSTSTHATGKTVKKYTYGTSGTPMYDFYVDTQTKVCLKFDDYVNDGHINLSIFSTSGNTWGNNGLPARPDGVTPEPTVLSVPVVTINNSGLASWTAVTNANSYKIKINGGAEEFAVGLSEQLTNGDTIQVKAVGDGETYSDSAWSAVQTYTEQGGEPQPTALTAPTVTINGTGLATWAAITNASGYKYKIDGGAEQTAPANRQVQLTDGQSITVKAVGDGTTYSDSAYSVSETYSSLSTPTYGDYVTLPQSFTLTYSGSDGETRTIVKDGDKLWYHIQSEYEDRECLAIKQSDNTYITYEKDNKQGAGSWGTDPEVDTITYSDDVYSALAGFESSLLSYAQCKVNGDTFQTGASTTVAGMTCNVYTKESGGYTDTYYTYNGLTFKYTETQAQGEPSVYFVVLTYSATGDLSGSAYSIY